MSVEVLLENPVAENALLRMFDLQGKALKEVRMQKGSTLQHLDISDVPDGLYIIEIHVIGGKKRYGKITVQH